MWVELQQSILRGFMVVSQMLFMVNHSCRMVVHSSLNFCLIFSLLYLYFLCIITGLPPLVLRRILEILTYLATNHSSVANMLFYFDLEAFPENLSSTFMETKKGKEKVVAGLLSSNLKNCRAGIVPLVLFLKLLNRPLFLRSVVRLEQV